MHFNQNSKSNNGFSFNFTNTNMTGKDSVASSNLQLSGNGFNLSPPNASSFVNPNGQISNKRLSNHQIPEEIEVQSYSDGTSENSLGLRGSLVKAQNLYYHRN